MELAATILNGAKENRGAFKSVELILYGQTVADLPFPEELDGEDAAQGEEAPPISTAWRPKKATRLAQK
jgi:hypothetical protein